MKSNTRYIKFVYILGMVMDAIWAVLLAVPELFKIVTRTPYMEITPETRVIFYIAASLMLGWTILLYYGFKKPLERRYILLITAFPVVTGIFIATAYSFINGKTPALFFMIKTLILIALFLTAYFKAGRLNSEQWE